MYSKGAKTTLWVLAFFLAAMFAFDALAGTQLLAIGADGMLIAPVAAAALPEAIKAELDNLRERVVEPIHDLQARMQHTEQMLAKMGTEGVHIANGASSAPSIGRQVTAKMAEDSDYQAASEAVSRGMKPGRMSCRVNLDGSIRAALVNEGRGNVGDTEYPRFIERNSNVPLVLPRLRLLDALPSRPVTGDAVEFIQLTATGEAAEQVLEGDLKAEIDMEGTLHTANIATIAAWTSASRQVLSDTNGLASKIDTLIRYKVLGKLEGLLVNGVGGNGKILGLIPQATAFAPTIGQKPADRIGESLVSQAEDGYQPNLVVMNPLDWFRLQITRTNTTDDEYVFGSPTSPIAPSLWNTTVVATPHMTEGQALTIDTSFVTVLDRQQASVLVATEHADYFVRNLIAILGELRAGLEVTDTRAVNIFALAPT